MKSKSFAALVAMLALPSSFANAGASSADRVTLFCADSEYWFAVPASPPPVFTSSANVKEDGEVRNQKVYATTKEELVTLSFDQGDCSVKLKQMSPSNWQREISCDGRTIEDAACEYRWY